MKRAHNFKDLTGKKFNRLQVLELAFIRKKTVYWKCKCDCGTTKILLGPNITRGGSKSCGCISLESKRLEMGESGFNRLFAEYKRGAKDRNLTFELTVTEFKHLTKGNCHYCGIIPSNTKRVTNKGRSSEEAVAYSGYIYNGIDRVDSKQGYSKTNCVPCCTTCNVAKNKRDYTEFKDWIKRLITFNTGKGN